MNNVIKLYCTKSEKIKYSKETEEFIARTSAIFMWRADEINKINNIAQEKLDNIKFKFEKERVENGNTRNM